MHKKEFYETPEMEIYKIYLGGGLLQASLEGFKDDDVFDPGLLILD